MKLTDLRDVNQELIEELVALGYSSVDQIIYVSPKKIANLVGVDEQEVINLIEKIKEQIGIFPRKAVDLYKEEKNKGVITTGSVNLDTMLGGGVWTREITELVGAYSTGKTQLCFQLSINVQLSKDAGGLEGKTFFIDTEGTFSPSRVAQMAIARGLDPNKILENILVGRAYNTDQQFNFLDELVRINKKEKIKLLIIDSIASHYRTEFTGTERLPERQQKIMKFAERLSQIAEFHNLAVVVTNQVLMNPDDIFSGHKIEPALGLAWAHRPQQRIFLRKAKSRARIARLFDSPRFPEQECIFYITEKGIVDEIE